MVLIVMIFGMIFEKKIGVSLVVIGCIGVFVLVVSGVFMEK